jgi:hypothetical protein
MFLLSEAFQKFSIKMDNSILIYIIYLLGRSGTLRVYNKVETNSLYSHKKHYNTMEVHDNLSVTQI